MDLNTYKILSNQVPTLRYHGFLGITEKNHWCLNISHENYSYELQIRYYHGDGNVNHYKFINYEDGEEVKLVSRDALMEQYSDILAHEGEEAADKWICDVKDVREFEAFEEYLMKELIARWEAMLTLKLFTPSINL